jgi:hypothetical protein
LKQLRKIIELLEVLEESNPDGRVKVIVGADEQEYFTSEVQAVLIFDGDIIFAPYSLAGDVPLEMDGRTNHKEMN